MQARLLIDNIWSLEYMNPVSYLADRFLNKADESYKDVVQLISNSRMDRF